MITYVSLSRKFAVETDSWMREVFFAKCCNWLNDNAGPISDAWWTERNAVNGNPYGFHIVDEADALVFKLKFNL